MSDLSGGDISPMEEFLEPIMRLTRDIKSAAFTLGDDEARFLVDFYYIIQEDRKRSYAQVRALETNQEPNEIITWFAGQSKRFENEIKEVLNVYTTNHEMGQYMRCSPAGSEVRTTFRTYEKIENLETGQSVTSFDRQGSYLTKPQLIEVASRPYHGDLVLLTCDATSTRTTPNHRWLAKLDKSKDAGVVVYLMRSGDKFRVGRCSFFTKAAKGSWLVNLRLRASQEQASVWVLKTFSSTYEANIYEDFVSTHYGLTEWQFKPYRGNHGGLVDQRATDKLFRMLDVKAQYERAAQCLLDHGKHIDFPFWSWTGSVKKQSPTQAIETAAYNLMPDVMLVPVPTSSFGKVDWIPITDLSRERYDGLVYSLDVARHHKFIQDDVITCNSIYGIGPVLSAGLLAHIDISKASTVGKIWQYAGIAGPIASVDTMRFQYRVTFDYEVDLNNPPKLMLEKKQEAIYLFPDGETEEGNSILLYQVILPGDEKPPKVVAPNNITYVCTKKVLSGQTPWLKGQKRPFNANLKVLLWKVGQSFMKFSNRPECYYGKVYRDRKIYEIERNEAGELAEQAAAKLLVLKDKTTDVYKCYESGKLPPGHIDARARRYAVKLFLAHMWETWYKLHFKKEPPKPYPIAILGHADYIPPPVKL